MVEMDQNPYRDIRYVLTFNVLREAGMYRGMLIQGPGYMKVPRNMQKHYVHSFIVPAETD